MDQRRCRYCQKSFQPSKFQPQQTVCSHPDCQRQRRSDYHRAKLASDIEYRDVCRDSSRKWRATHPGYWKEYREKNPSATEQNRGQQMRRDQKRKLCHLANNTSVLDLKHSAANVWLVGPGAALLANNNSAAGQVWVIEALVPAAGAVTPSCKQHPAGLAAPTDA